LIYVQHTVKMSWSYNCAYTPEPVTIRMGKCLRRGKPSQHHSGQLSLVILLRVVAKSTSKN